MEITVGGRGAGKTHHLLEWVKQSRARVIVVATEERARDLRGRLGGDMDERVISLDNIRSLRGGYMKVAIDDLDQVFEALFGYHVFGATWGSQGRELRVTRLPEDPNPFR